MNYLTRTQHGFTLIEMMVVIVIIAILAAIAVPSFDAVIRRNNVESLQSRLTSAISIARSEAASRNKQVSICPTANQADCTAVATDWSNGWIVFVNQDGDATIDAEDERIDVNQLSSGYSLTAKSGFTLLTFNSRGFTATGDSLFIICDSKKQAADARGLFINRSGLVVKTRDGSDSDTEHDDPTEASKNLTCPN